MWSCDYSQSGFANSRWSGLTSPSTKPSKGTPTWKSTSPGTASNMITQAVGTPAIGNPLRTKEDYLQQLKWGNPVVGTNGKWSISRPDIYESGIYYEGE